MPTSPEPTAARDRLEAMLREIERLAWPMDGRAATEIVNLTIKARRELSRVCAATRKRPSITVQLSDRVVELEAMLRRILDAEWMVTCDCDSEETK